MEDHDVARPDHAQQILGVLAQHFLIELMSRVVERPTVAGRTVDGVVQSLCEAEEVGPTLDHEPARVDTDAASVAEQPRQELCDPAAHRRRVHVPDGAPAQQSAGGLREAIRLRNRLRAHVGAEALHVEG